MRISLLLTLLPSLLLCKQFRFPQGYFNTKYLQPFEAIYLNLLAQSNMENGGITLEELEELSEARERITWEEHIATSTLHPPVLPKESSTVDVVKEKSGGEETFEKREHDSPMEDNPFEEISTRAPPGEWARGGWAPPTVSRPQPTVSRSQLPSRPSHRQPPSTPTKSFVPLTHDQIIKTRRWIDDARSATVVRETSTVSTNAPIAHKLRANNPFARIDIYKPTILRLPIPPEI